jgi:hypothetical protein
VARQHGKVPLHFPSQGGRLIERRNREFLSSSHVRSILRGVSHIQSCTGCARLLCHSTRKLVKRCAQHVRSCPLLSCRQCASCKISRMVQVAWQVAQNTNTNPTKAKSE